eukprot:TRINITY_DN6388_c0_g1_i4.p1 TRINITY_DN6388_c0_g1~~TRINITY_DN6388_c0_g1_i4.p1  ORF type:complete len:1028 (+),score=331.23 TRINITY_DN6388_c0_g1_i4:166-3084(+)
MTYEGYYNEHVRHILSNVHRHLNSNPDKTFIWAEVSFFKLWWETQPLNIKEDVKRMVKSGQWEFVGGGWVQNDEAAASLDVVIGQVSAGHEYLLKHFGVRPRIGWQIDPFGHSSLTPTIFAQVGYQALVLNRIHHQLKGTYIRDSDLEFIWRPSPTLGDATQIFAHVLHTHYSAPIGFDWEEHSTPINEHNLEGQSQHLVNILKERSRAYRTNQLMVPWGDDFKFQNADIQYDNMGKLIEHINSNIDKYHVKIQYSTLSRYFDAVKNMVESGIPHKVEFSAYYGDFFPYADNEDSYWTGYYTTRPQLKGMHRHALSVLRSAEMLYVLGRTEAHGAQVPWDHLFRKLQTARWDNSLVAHHDGITGTSRSNVVDDYSGKLRNSIGNSRSVMADMCKILLSKKGNTDLQLEIGHLNWDLRGNVGTTAMVFHNSLGWERSQFVAHVVKSRDLYVTGPMGNVVPSQIVPIWTDAGLKPEDDKFLIYFPVGPVPPLALSSYFLEKSTTTSKKAEVSTYMTYLRDYNAGLHAKTKNLSPIQHFSISNDFLKIEFEHGVPTRITQKATGDVMKFSVALWQYSTQRSGAYLFRSESRPPTKLSEQPIRVQVVEGPVLSEVKMFFNSDNSITLRLYNNIDREIGKLVEISHTITPVGSNTEIVARYTSDVKQDNDDGVFYTDNGLELLQRKLRAGSDTRPEANYYPVQSTVALKGETHQMNVLVRQPAGATLIGSDTLEVMLHRKLEQDDGRGLAEAVRDMTTITNVHWLLWDSIEISRAIRPRIALQLEHPLRMMHSNQFSRSDWDKQYKMEYKPLVAPIPPRVHIQDFRSRDGVSDEAVLRFVQLEPTDPVTATPEVIDINSLLTDFNLKATRAVTISLNNEPGKAFKRVIHDYPLSGKLLQALDGPSLAPVAKGASQNSAEAGVFLSQSALDKMKKDKEKEKEKPAVKAPNVEQEAHRQAKRPNSQEGPKKNSKRRTSI